MRFFWLLCGSMCHLVPLTMGVRAVGTLLFNENTQSNSSPKAWGEVHRYAGNGVQQCNLWGAEDSLTTRGWGGKGGGKMENLTIAWAYPPTNTHSGKHLVSGCVVNRSWET